LKTTRQIKFRGMDENGIWRTIDLTGSMGWAKELLSMLAENENVFNFKTPLLQFTGLKDKNGKEIYEGDVVCNEWTSINGKDIGYTWVVKFGEYGNSDIEYGSEGHVGFYVEKIEGSDDEGAQEGLHNLPNDDGSRLPRVIGNIHENPEFLCKP